MKKYIFISGLVLISLFLINCEKDNGTAKKIAFVNTEIGGCNNIKFEELKSQTREQNDSVVFFIRNDTLNTFVGVNYICCAPFISEVSLANDSLIMSLTDTCSKMNQSCYCRCMCYYTWDFQFVNFEQKKYYFQIVLNNPREVNPVIVKEGMINLDIKK